jgi:hypothetical protein
MKKTLPRFPQRLPPSGCRWLRPELIFGWVQPSRRDPGSAPIAEDKHRRAFWVDVRTPLPVDPETFPRRSVQVEH